MKMEINKFKPLWKSLEDPSTQPKRVRDIKVMQYDNFKKKVYQQDNDFIKSIINSLYAGDFYILRNGIPKSFCEEVKQNTFAWGLKKPSEFYKMIEGIPDYHRIIDKSVTNKYKLNSNRHNYYFFPWNHDPLNLFTTLNDRWRMIKFLVGLKKDQYEKNTPNDGVVDRIVITHYPRGTGELETHSDPCINQRLTISLMMSKKGIDFESGGVFLLDKSNNKIDLEDKLNIGDIVIGYPTIVHGVDIIDKGAPIDWNKNIGRWWIGLNSTSSDINIDRKSQEPYNSSV